jgi:putative peptide zinc metalloprotease protein
MTPASSGPPPTSGSTQVTAFPFKLPSPPGPGGTQAVAVGTKNNGVTYDVAYALVTVRNGAPVTNSNSAFALANCKSCTTVAVSFQVVLVVGQSNIVAPINAAGALNVNCPACMTVAIADQIVKTVAAAPSQTLVQELETELKQLDGLSALGGSATPAAIAATVAAIQQQIETTIATSGLLPKQTTTATTSTTSTSTTSTSTTSTSTSTTGTVPASSTATTTTKGTPTATTPVSTSTTPTTTETGTTTTSG